MRPSIRAHKSAARARSSNMTRVLLRTSGAITKPRAVVMGAAV